MSLKRSRATCNMECPRSSERVTTIGYSNVSIAKEMGVSVGTFKRWLEENEKLQEAFEQGREVERLALHTALYQAAMAGKPANVNAMFLLKARFGYVEADRLSQRVSVDVAVTNVMVVKDHGSDEDWERNMAEQQKKLVQNATL